MSTERTPHEPADGPGIAPNDFADAAAEGDLFIRDLPSTSTPAPPLAAQSSTGDEGYDEEDEGIVTTQMLGEEGDRGGGKEKDKKDKKDKDVVTTLALGEEGGGEYTS